MILKSIVLVLIFNVFKFVKLESYQSYYNFAPCPCNLTENECDINCCCDQECSTEDLNIFKCIIGPFGGNIVETKTDYNKCNTEGFIPIWQLFLCIIRENNAYLGTFFEWIQSTSTSFYPEYSFRIDNNLISEDIDYGCQIGNTTSVNNTEIFLGYARGDNIVTGIFDVNSSKINNIFQNRVHLFNPDHTGVCSHTNFSEIYFQTNSLNQCFTTINSTYISNCVKLKEFMFQNLNKLMPSDRISVYQNSSSTNSTQWILIFKDDISYIFNSSNDNSTITNGTKLEKICRNVPSGISLTILYSSIGTIGGRDFLTIVGAKIMYELSTWRFVCKGGHDASCIDASSARKFIASSSTKFLRVDRQPSSPSPQPTAYEARIRATESICNEDTCWSRLFYPFSDYNLGQSRQYRSLAFIVCLVIVVLVLLGGLFFSDLTPSNIKTAFAS